MPGAHPPIPTMLWLKTQAHALQRYAMTLRRLADECDKKAERFLAELVKLGGAAGAEGAKSKHAGDESPATPGNLDSADTEPGPSLPGV